MFISWSVEVVEVEFNERAGKERLELGCLVCVVMLVAQERESGAGRLGCLVWEETERRARRVFFFSTSRKLVCIGTVRLV